MKVLRHGEEEGHKKHSLVATGRSALEDDVCEAQIWMSMPSILRERSEEP